MRKVAALAVCLTCCAFADDTCSFLSGTVPVPPAQGLVSGESVTLNGLTVNADDDEGDGSNRIILSSRAELNHQTRYVVFAAHSMRGSVIRRARLSVERPGSWLIEGCRMNGRKVPVCDGAPLLGDVPRGAAVELDVVRIGVDDDQDDGVFRATIEGEPRGPRVGDVVELNDGGREMVVAGVFERPAAVSSGAVVATTATGPGHREQGVLVFDTSLAADGRLSVGAAYRMPPASAWPADAAACVESSSAASDPPGPSCSTEKKASIVAWWRDESGALQIAEFDAGRVKSVR